MKWRKEVEDGSANMSNISYIICLTSDAGIPLYSKNLGNKTSLPFPVLGSINGVHMFAKNHKMDLTNTITENGKIVWKEFYSSVTLIVVSSKPDVSDFHLHLLLDNVFSAMVLTIGLFEFQDTKSPEKLKKELRTCQCLIESVVSMTPLFGNFLQATDIIICSDTSLLQDCLDSFVEACDSVFGCLLVFGKIVIATERWWQLVPTETMLILLLLRSIPPSSSRDIPIYLPHGSPKIPHRLITLEIIEGVEICVICGPQPSLQTILDRHVLRYWNPVQETLRTCTRSHPRNLPAAITVDTNILGFILLNIDEGKCLASIYPCGIMTGGETLSSEQRQEILISYYQSVVGTLFPPQDIAKITGESSKDDLKVALSDEVMDTYVLAEDYKCYAMRNDTHQIFILFSKEIPVYAMNSVAEVTLKKLTKDQFI